MSFAKLKETLEAEGWYVGWNHYCCQSCAWMDVPDDADLSKVLFNHSQDCEVDAEYQDCPECGGDAIVENPDYDTENLANETDDDLDEFIDCPHCDGQGSFRKYDEEGDYDMQHASNFVCYYPEQTNGSYFCFDGSKKGCLNLKNVLELIEQCDCKIEWNGSGNNRPYISWSK